MFGIDVWDPAVQKMPWRALRKRIGQLLTDAPIFLPDGRTMMSTRLGRALYPTDPPQRS